MTSSNRRYLDVEIGDLCRIDPIAISRTLHTLRHDPGIDVNVRWIWSSKGQLSNDDLCVAVTGVHCVLYENVVQILVHGELFYISEMTFKRFIPCDAEEQTPATEARSPS